MLIGILLNRVTWEIKQIVKELEKKNLNYELLNNQKLFFKLTNQKDLNKPYDLFLERSLSYMRGLYATAILESKGYEVINNYDCLNLTGNKLLTSLKLVEKGIPTPETCVAFKDEATIQVIDRFMEYPVVIKPIIGSWGRLIARLDDYNSAVSNIECRETMGNVLQKIYYLQKFISQKDDSKPTDIRVLMIGDEPVAAMGRFHPEKDFRSNIAIGGTAELYPMDDELKNICIKARQAVKGEIVGIDLMIEDGNLVVIEVNGTPQFRGVSQASKINVAQKIVEHIQNRII